MLIQSSSFLLHALINPSAVSEKSNSGIPILTFYTVAPVCRRYPSASVAHPSLFSVLSTRGFARLSLLCCSSSICTLDRCPGDYLEPYRAYIGQGIGLLRDYGRCLHNFCVFLCIRSLVGMYSLYSVDYVYSCLSCSHWYLTPLSCLCPHFSPFLSSPCLFYTRHLRPPAPSATWHRPRIISY